MKKPPLAFALALLALTAAVGWLGYRGAAGSSGVATQPTPGPEARTVRVTRGDVRQVLVVPAEVVPALQRELSFPVGGRLAKLAVRPGDTVTQGQTLARLETQALEQAVALAQAELEVKQAALERLKAGPSDADLAAARADLAAAKARLNQLQAGPSAADLAIARADLAAARARLEKLKAGPDPAAVERARFALETAKNSLWGAQVHRDAICGQEGPKWQCDQAEAAVGVADVAVRQAQAELNRLLAGPSRDEIQMAELEVQKAQARLEQLTAGPPSDELAMAKLEVERAQARLAQLTAGPNPMEVEQAEAAVRAAEAALARAQADLAAATLTAPFSGTVLAVKAQPGDAISANVPIIELADLAQLEVLATVGQEDVSLVQPGQPATLRFDARPGESFPGRVDRVVPKGTEGGGVVTYRVFIVPDQVPPGLLPGMTADVEIVVAERKDVLTLPRRAIRTRPNTTVSVAVLEGGQAVTRSVKKVGLVGDLNVEILSGLQEGDRVVAER